jgi:alcohol dehydrogenase, propanol-preferring
MTARAARLQAPRGAVAVDCVELREPGPGEVLIRMEACGICHSDLFVAAQERLAVTPLTLGHEGIGRVVKVGQALPPANPALAGGSAGPTFVPGDRVGMTFLATTCGTCELCRTGHERFCAKQTNFGFSLHGALTEYAIAPAAGLVRVPEDVPATTLAPMCCAGWTAFGAVREAGLQPGQTVALFGFGGLGHLALAIARSQGLRVAVADVSEAKLEMARAAGAEITAPGDYAGRTLQKEHGGVDAAIVLTGSPAAIPQAFKALKRLGTMVLVGVSLSQYELPLVDTVVKGLQIRGSYLGPREDLESVFALASTGALQPHVESHEIGETPELLERMKRGEILGRAVIGF